MIGLLKVTHAIFIEHGDWNRENGDNCLWMSMNHKTNSLGIGYLDPMTYHVWWWMMVHDDGPCGLLETTRTWWFHPKQQSIAKDQTPSERTIKQAVGVHVMWYFCATVHHQFRQHEQRSIPLCRGLRLGFNFAVPRKLKPSSVKAWRRPSWQTPPRKLRKSGWFADFK